VLRLALDTSTRLGGVALGEDARLLAESCLSVRATHSETVLPEVRRLLRRADREIDEVEEIVVGSGPGSFTGVRIAASLAKGLCAATGARLSAFSSLAAVAAGTGLASRVCVLFEARRDELYGAGYETTSPLSARFGPAVLRVEEALEACGDPDGWAFAGGGAISHRDALEDRGGRVLSPLHEAPRAGALLALAVDQPGAGTVDDPAAWEPGYVRASGAERGAVG
jgi:tRNA threonylcarbamoyladenosine biosynthesis protein TsaB